MAVGRPPPLLMLLLAAVGVAAVGETGVDWSAHGTNWQEGQCASRELASPINLDELDVKVTARTAIGFKYNYPDLAAEKAKLVVKNDGGKIFVDFAGVKQPGALGTDSGEYDLIRMDFRAPSEHTFRGHRAKMEVQLVHRSKASGKIVTASVLYDEDAAAGTAAKVKYALVQEDGDEDEPLMSETAKEKMIDEGAIAKVGELARNAEELESEGDLKKIRRLRGGKRKLLRKKLVHLHNASAKAFKKKSGNLIDAILGSGDGDFKNDLPATGSEVEKEVGHGEIGAFLESLFTGNDFFYYSGSSTAPPCEQTQWLVRRKLSLFPRVGEIADKLNEMTDGAGGNFRALMPRNERIVHVVRVERVDGLGAPKKIDPTTTMDPGNLAFRGDKYSEAASRIAWATKMHALDIDNRAQRQHDELANYHRTRPQVGILPPVIPLTPEQQELQNALVDHATDSATNIVARLGKVGVGEVTKIR